MYLKSLPITEVWTLMENRMKHLIISAVAITMLASPSFAAGFGEPGYDNPNVPNCVFMKHIPNCENVFWVIGDRQSYRSVPAPASSGAIPSGPVTNSPIGSDPTPTSGNTCIVTSTVVVGSVTMLQCVRDNECTTVEHPITASVCQ